MRIPFVIVAFFNLLDVQSCFGVSASMPPAFDIAISKPPAFDIAISKFKKIPICDLLFGFNS